MNYGGYSYNDRSPNDAAFVECVCASRKMYDHAKS